MGYSGTCYVGAKMNIFWLDNSPYMCVVYLCDKHVVKMTLETAQMLSTYIYKKDGKQNPLVYKPTHQNHPCTTWLCSSPVHYSYMVEYFKRLCTEYRHRFGRIHACEALTTEFDKYTTCTAPYYTMFACPPPMCMPDKYKAPDDKMLYNHSDKDTFRFVGSDVNKIVDAYRDYYIGEKLGFAKWTKRDKPTWSK